MECSVFLCVGELHDQDAAALELKVIRYVSKFLCSLLCF